MEGLSSKMERIKERTSENEDRTIEIAQPKKEKKIKQMNMDSRTSSTITKDRSPKMHQVAADGARGAGQN